MVGLVIVVLISAGGLFFLNSQRGKREESLLHKQLQAQGAIAVINIATSRVASVNLSSLSDPSKTSEVVEQLASLRQLHALDLQRLPISDSDLTAVGKLRSLKSLNLNHSSITDAGLTHLSRLGDLESLNLVGTKITNAGLVALAGMKSLRVLDISDTAITGGLATLADLPRLEWLVMRNLDVGKSVTELATSRSLLRLSVEGTSVDTDACNMLRSALPELSIDGES